MPLPTFVALLVAVSPSARLSLCCVAVH